MTYTNADLSELLEPRAGLPEPTYASTGAFRPSPGGAWFASPYQASFEWVPHDWELWSSVPYLIEALEARGLRGWSFNYDSFTWRGGAEWGAEFWAEVKLRGMVNAKQVNAASVQDIPRALRDAAIEALRARGEG